MRGPHAWREGAARKNIRSCFTFRQVAPLPVRVLLLGQGDGGLSGHVAAGNLMAVVHLAIGASPDVEVFPAGELMSGVGIRFFKR